MKKQKLVAVLVPIFSIILLIIPTIIMLSRNFYSNFIDLVGDFLIYLPLTILGTIGSVYSIKKIFELL